MDNSTFIILFVVIFFIFYNIFSARQKKFSLPGGLAEKGAPERLETKKAYLKGVFQYLLPLAQKLFATTKVKKGLVRDLVTAGSPLTTIEYYALVLFSSVLGFVLGVIFMKIMAKKAPNYMIPLIATSVGFYIPGIWLKQRMKKRQNSIAKELPSVIDLLNLCVGSGIDFMLAVQRVIRDYKRCPLTEELSTLWRENSMGTPRKEALKNLSWRVNLPEISSFVSTLIQADRMGTPISDALEIQAEQIRIKRFQRGEENALRAPIMLLIPLIFFILPVVAIIVAAPILLQFMKGGIKF